MLTPSDIEHHLQIARSIVEQAGEIALKYFRQPLAVENKLEGQYFDPVTVADREVEAYIRKKLCEHFPGYKIIGEEEGASGEDSEHCWIIDPIDGTRAFISGVPAWGILLGLMERSSCLGGLMRQPYVSETYVGSQDGAWLYHRDDKIPLRTRGEAALEDAILYCTHPDMFENREDRMRFDSVAEACRLSRFGGDCYSYGMLAHGQIDLVIEGSLEPYDIIPLIPIIEAAGGVVSNIDGELPLQGGLVIAAANRELHSRALELMQEQ